MKINNQFEGANIFSYEENHLIYKQLLYCATTSIAQLKKYRSRFILLRREAIISTHHLLQAKNFMNNGLFNHRAASLKIAYRL